ncbi:MAG: hypothetical protein KDA71_11790 [Planctomycetales bacterium]|nr:hypothetical protein [Planctomycetales bacterium]
MNVTILWDLDDDEDGNVCHIAEHGLDKDDVGHVFDHPIGSMVSHSSSRPIVFGFIPDGRYIAVVYEFVDEDMVYPITAYEVPEPT